MGDDSRDLFLGHAVLFGVFQMELQRRIGHTGRHQRHHRDDAAGLDIDAVIVPVLTEQDIIVIMCKCRGKLAKSVPASGLYNFLHRRILPLNIVRDAFILQLKPWLKSSLF